MRRKLDAYTASSPGLGHHAATISLKPGYHIINQKALDALKSGCAHDLTKAQANKLRGLITRHTSRQAEAAHAGAQPPEDAEQMRREAIEAAEALWTYLRGVTL